MTQPYTGNIAPGGDGLSFQCEPDTRPELSVRAYRSDWGILADYQQGLLTVVYEIGNRSGSDASLVRTIGAKETSSHVDLVTVMPLSLGELPIGDCDSFKLQYRIPAGVNSFSTLLHATAMTADGNTHHYPVETSDSSDALRPGALNIQDA